MTMNEETYEGPGAIYEKISTVSTELFRLALFGYYFQYL
jgi:hypothetical protein